MHERVLIKIGRTLTVRRRNKALYTVHYTLQVQLLCRVREADKQSIYFAAP